MAGESGKVQIHAGGIIESKPSRQKGDEPLRLKPPKGKENSIAERHYDFFMQEMSVDCEGYALTSVEGARHPALREDGRSCTYRPSVRNVAPRPPDWQRPSLSSSTG